MPIVMEATSISGQMRSNYMTSAPFECKGYMQNLVNTPSLVFSMSYTANKSAGHEGISIILGLLLLRVVTTLGFILLYIAASLIFQSKSLFCTLELPMAEGGKGWGSMAIMFLQHSK